MTFKRLAGIAGVVFVALLVVNGALAGDTPLAGDSVEEIRDYLSSDSGMHKTSLVIGMVLLPPAVLFFSGVVAKIRVSDAAHGENWATVVLLGAVLLGASAGLGDVLFGATLFRGGEGLDDASLRALWDGQIIAYSSTGIATTAFTAGAAIPTLQHGFWPKWHAALGVVAAALGVLALIAVVEDTNGGSMWGFLGFIGMAVWSLATSVLLIREPASAGPA